MGKLDERLVDFSIQNLSEGIDAIGQVSVRVASHAGARRSYGGYGTDVDILVASAKAYLAAVNRLIADQRPDLTAQAGKRQPEPLAAGWSADETFDPAYTAGIP